MKARILVCRVDDHGDEYTVLETIADEGVMGINDDYLPSELNRAQLIYGETLITHGFVDIEIPDSVIDQVLCRTATAGVVPAQAVEEPK